MECYTLDNDTLWKRDQAEEPFKIMLPQTMVPRILHEHHEHDGHPGVDETFRAIQAKYRWPGMRNEIRSHVSQFYLCACCKSSNAPAVQGLLPHQPKYQWDTVVIDLMGPYQRSARGRFLLVVTDMFSRWTEAFPIGLSVTARVTKLVEEEVFSRWDNHAQFFLIMDLSSLVKPGRRHASAGVLNIELQLRTIHGPIPRKGETRRLRRVCAYIFKEKNTANGTTTCPPSSTRRNAATGLTPGECYTPRALAWQEFSPTWRIETRNTLKTKQRCGSTYQTCYFKSTKVPTAIYKCISPLVPLLV